MVHKKGFWLVNFLFTSILSRSEGVYLMETSVSDLAWSRISSSMTEKFRLFVPFQITETSVGEGLSKSTVWKVFFP